MTRLSKKVPTEFQEQVKLAQYLDYKNYCWIHVPNGGNRDAKTGAKMKKQGTKAGFPDVIIFDVPEGAPDSVRGIVIELKRQEGGRLQDSQVQWITNLGKRNWYAKVCRGADEAIDWLEELFEV